MVGDRSIDRYASVHERVAAATRRSGRADGAVSVVGASKGQPLEEMLQYKEWCDQQKTVCIFGENYVQELSTKVEEGLVGVDCHLIGHLQRNKIRQALPLFSCIQSLDSERLIRSLEEELDREGRVVSGMVQVNVSSDPRKGGFLPDALDPLFERLFSQPTSIKIIGLMTITELYSVPELARGDFASLREIAKGLEERFSIPPLALSMGMSDDFEIAIEEGATIVRIGSALFGPRR